MMPSFPEQFVPVCRYRAIQVKPGRVEPDYDRIEWLHESLLKERGTVYARGVFGSLPVYIGCAHGTLRGRIMRHLSVIYDGLGREYWDWAKDKEITVIAYKPETVDVLGRTVSIYRGLERALIEEFKPKPPDSRPWFVSRA